MKIRLVSEYGRLDGVVEKVFSRRAIVRTLFTTGAYGLQREYGLPYEIFDKVSVIEEKIRLFD